jgi:hypothetical protein
MAVTSTVNQSVLNVLLEQAAQGNIKPYNLLGSVTQGEVFSYGNTWVRYRKLRPGHFLVEKGANGQDNPDTTIPADTPVEAKLGTIEVLIDAAREAIKAKQQPQAPQQ